MNDDLPPFRGRMMTEVSMNRLGSGGGHRKSDAESGGGENFDCTFHGPFPFPLRPPVYRRT